MASSRSLSAVLISSSRSSISFSSAANCDLRRPYSYLPLLYTNPLLQPAVSEGLRLPPSQAVAQKGILSIQEKFLPGAGENLTPASLPESAIALVQNTLKAAYEAVGCKGYVRIDCFYQQAHESLTGKERVVFLEFNTLPGLTPATCLFHQAAEVGIRPMEFIDIIIELGFENHKRKDAQGEKLVSPEKKGEALSNLPKKKRVEPNQVNQQTLQIF